MFNNKVFFDYLLNDDVNGAMNYVEEMFLITSISFILYQIVMKN